MNMLEGGFDNDTDDNSLDSPAPETGDQYLISSFKPERLSWKTHEPNTRTEISSHPISSRRVSGERRGQSTAKTRARQQTPPNFVNNQLFSDKVPARGKYSSFEDTEAKFEMRSQDADIANHRQYDIRYSDLEPLPERVDPRVSQVTRAPSKQGGGRSHGHNGQFYEGENVERGDYGPQRYSDPDRALAERQSRYQDTGYHDHHHPVSRGQSYPVTRRQDYYDPYEDSQPAYNDHVLTRQTGADRQLASLG